MSKFTKESGSFFGNLGQQRLRNERIWYLYTVIKDIAEHSKQHKGVLPWVSVYGRVAEFLTEGTFKDYLNVLEAKNVIRQEIQRNSDGSQTKIIVLIGEFPEPESIKSRAEISHETSERMNFKGESKNE